MSNYGFARPTPSPSAEPISAKSKTGDYLYFREDVTRLLADLRVEAAKGSSAEVEEYSTIYSLLQCAPDLLSEDCRKCLADLADEMLRVVDISRGVRMLGPNCIMRYELYPFYNDTRLRELRVLPPLPPSPSPTGRNDGNVFLTDNSRGNKNNNTKKVVTIVVPISVCLTLAASALIFLRKRMKRPSSQEIIETIDEISTVESLQYDLGQIRAATIDFDDSNKLGQGGFGAVYRGKTSRRPRNSSEKIVEKFRTRQYRIQE